MCRPRCTPPSARASTVLIPSAKRTLNAAAVIGSAFDPDLLAALIDEPDVGCHFVAAELVDQVRCSPRAEYAFRHPLIRAVAYESQLKSDRAQLHRRLALRDRRRMGPSMRMRH